MSKSSNAHEVTIYGASDDLVEIEGAISEEFSAYDEEDGVYVCVDGGALVHVQYGVGGAFWRLNVIDDGGMQVEKFTATSDDGDDYSDRVTLKSEHPIKWAVMGKDKAK